MYYAGSFTHDLHRKFLFFDFAARKRNTFSRPGHVVHVRGVRRTVNPNIPGSVGHGAQTTAVTAHLP